MQITTCLLVLCNQSGAESCQLVSSLFAYEHSCFGLELFESDLQLQFLSYSNLPHLQNDSTYVFPWLSSSNLKLMTGKWNDRQR